MYKINLKKIKIYSENSKLNWLKRFYFIKNCIPKLDLSLLKYAFKDMILFLN